MDVLKMEALVLRIEPSCVIYVSAGNGEESVGGGGGYGEQRQQQHAKSHGPMEPEWQVFMTL